MGRMSSSFTKVPCKSVNSSGVLNVFQTNSTSAVETCTSNGTKNGTSRSGDGRSMRSRKRPFGPSRLRCTNPRLNKIGHTDDDGDKQCVRKQCGGLGGIAREFKMIVFCLFVHFLEVGSLGVWLGGQGGFSAKNVQHRAHTIPEDDTSHRHRTQASAQMDTITNPILLLLPRPTNQQATNSSCTLRIGFESRAVLKQLYTPTRKNGTQQKAVRRVTMIPGDGVGPELMLSVKDVFKAAEVPVEFEEHQLSEVQGTATPSKLEKLLQDMRANRVAIKGKLNAPMEVKGELNSYEMELRRQMDLFANVVRCKSLLGCATRHPNLDLVVIREQTEGEYSSLEHESVSGVVECLKIVTRKKSQRIAKFAFDYATRHGRRAVTAVHKANIMKLGDGLFLQCCEEVSQLYPKIKFNSMIVDNCCMQLVRDPYQFDVLLTPNLYGNVLDHVVAGLVGGAGVVPGESYSADYAVFETGARHPFAQAVGRNIANPTAMLLTAANMLHHLNLNLHAKMISDAVKKVIQIGKVRTRDVGGYSTTTDFVQTVIDNMRPSIH